MTPNIHIQSDLIELTEIFNYQTSTHTYAIKWCSLGDNSSVPLIFIHGTPWSSHVWISYALALSHQFHVYLFDNPGFGSSPLELRKAGTDIATSPSKMVQLDANLARQSEVFAALFKSWERNWGDKKAHIVAHDHGRLMSLRAHLLHDCAYASLCLINAVAIGPFGKPLFNSVAEKPNVFEQLPDMAFEGILESYIRQAAYKELDKETMQVLKVPWLMEGGKARFVRQLCQAASRSTEEVEGRYGEVGQVMPLKIIWGANDGWIPVETAERLGKVLQAKEVVLIKDAGHLVMYDQPAQLGIELGVWLSTQIISE
jgi:pimeloyl-ACP methyl ester carboxylesterase